ncbi:MAG TPA: DUF1178 family protein [Afifellaceae bacterium]|nr:DUF1178 family protein [Afifellaceae bacterium]
MIRFSLACSAGHKFEGWFASSGAFETQKERRVLLCPVCGDADVDKALMTPSVATARRKDAVRVAAHTGPSEEPEMVSMLRKLRKHLTDNADYVGNRFAEEARRIHYDEVEKRGIYGEASSDEVRSLAEEGIEFHPLPVLPEDHN